MGKAVNSIELKLGQVWENAQGHLIDISVLTTSQEFPFGSKNGFTYRCDGRFLSSTANPNDLVRLISDDSLKTWVPSGADGGRLDLPGGPGIEVNAAGLLVNKPMPTDAGIGDINSHAKGSGARFNTGKVPYELVPLEVMALHYERLLLEDMPIDADPCTPYEAALALSYLGAFQAQRPEADLTDVLVELGDGWEECARVFEYGAKKYKKNNWQKGMNWSVPLSCAARHLICMINGEELDEESGLAHRGHIFCNIVMLWTFLETYPEGDDRPGAGSLSVGVAA